MGRTTIKLHKIPPFCAITLIFTISIFVFHVAEAAGFTIDLIHRDYLESPSIHSPFHGIQASLQRSFIRAKTLTQDHSPQLVSADIISNRGEYLMRIGLGTPRVETLAVADTGSDLTWIQCTPCIRCFRQKAPIFVPSRSSTYKPVPCRSVTCNSVQRSSCNRAKDTCIYSLLYGDRSYSAGDVATEKVTLGNNVSIPRFIMGCGHSNAGTFSADTSGIIGLGGGKESLIRQLGSSIAGKFSYCLIPLFARATMTSKMHFGDEAVVSGVGVAKTPIVAKSPATYYYLTLVGMSVESQRFDLDSSSYYSHSDDEAEKLFTRGGNIIIDSGTTLTFLPSKLYRQVEMAVKRLVRLKPAEDPAQQLSLCYDVAEVADGMIPDITVHFRGANVKLKPYNAFFRVSERTLCFAFVPSRSLAIYGNLAQMNFLIGYDLLKKTVSFKPTDCTRSAQINA